MQRFTSDLSERARELDDELFQAKLRREENFLFKFPSPEGYTNILLKHIILQQMRRMLDDVADPSKSELESWITDHETQNLQQQIPTVSHFDKVKKYWLSGGQLGRFYEAERGRWLMMGKSFRRLYNGMINEPLSERTLKYSSRFVINGTLNLLLTLIMPVRLLSVACIELSFSCAFLVHLLRDYVQIRNQAIMSFLESSVLILSFVASVVYFDLNIYNVVFDFIAITLGIHNATLFFWRLLLTDVVVSEVMFMSLFSIPMLYAIGFVYHAFAKLQSWYEQVFSSNLSATAHPSMSIDPAQRQALIRLLAHKKMAVENNTEFSPDKKQHKQAKIQSELGDLFKKSTPYLLSKMDKKIIRAQEPVPTAFENVDLDAFSRPSSP